MPTESRSEYQEPPRLTWCPSWATKEATVGGVTDPVFNSRFEGLQTPQRQHSEKSWAEKGGISRREHGTMNPGRQVVRTPGKDLWEWRGWAWEQYLVASRCY